MVRAVRCYFGGVMMDAAVVVNGHPYTLGDVPLNMNLLTWLRSQGFTGTKEGCSEGECGACAVLLARPDGQGGRWEAVNACLLPALAAAGRAVLTAEGLSAPGVDLHPVQREMAVRGGSQCGFCTPGFVVSLAGEYYRPDRATEQHGNANGFDLHALSGNLCRCTGYRPIQQAALALGQTEAGDALGQVAPPVIQAFTHDASGGVFHRPASLVRALELLAASPDLKVVAGSTDWGVEVNLRHLRASGTLLVSDIPELRVFDWQSEKVVIGAALTLSEVERRLGGRIPLLAQLFPQFASRLIRNAATLGGNLGTASPIGDSAPVLLALEASVVLVSTAGERTVPLSGFFTGYRKTVLQPGELIQAVEVPLPALPVASFFKVAKRRSDDISSVAFAFALDVQGGVVQQARIGLGGVAATPIRALNTEAALVGQPWTAETARRVAGVLAQEGTPLDDHRASARYRQAMLSEALPRLHATSAHHRGKL